ncbi:glycosyltransferase family 87 protein [Corynebacterium anserum]|uniref:DUF2029 domain-containing protein n=1 Tax=Corynebacterium anserum TaxID=2684406 RepID=A0A7G7YQM5_9CORY|nr:glycosyltransferase 87 family protein [Corynebacterium anserum]QNH96795.1 DUF2029 domain-containing protein [Corynebacterium anserum]
MAHTQRVLPSRSEPMARGFAEFIGGAPGRHAVIGQQHWWTPLRVMLALSAVFLSLGWLQKANCLRTGFSEGLPFTDWGGRRQYTSACYSDIVVLYHSRGFDQGGFPYAYSWHEGELTRYLEYPVVTGLFQWLMAGITRPVETVWSTLSLPVASSASVNFGVTAVFLAVFWMASCAIVARLAGNRTWDTVLMAASPLVIVHAFTNYDALSIFFALAAFSLWAKNKPMLAGVMAGVGIAAKLWPIFIVTALVLLCLRARAWKTLATLLGSTVATWVALNLPLYVMYPRAWSEFFRLNSSRGWEGSTIYAVLAHISGQDGWDGNSPGHVVQGVEVFNLITLGLLVTLLGALTYAVLRAPWQPRVAEVAFLAVLAFMITNKVWSPQYSLWLVPLIVLALPRWRLALCWAGVEAVYWYLRMWQFLPENEAAPYWVVDLFTLVRLGLLVAMAVIIVRQMYGHSWDAVRAAHEGRDPLAGPLRC